MQTFHCSLVIETCHFYDKATGAEVTAALTAWHTVGSGLKAGRLAPPICHFWHCDFTRSRADCDHNILQGPPFHDDEQPNPQTAALPQRSLNVDLGTSDSRGRGRN